MKGIKRLALIQIHKSAGESRISVRGHASDMSALTNEALRIYGGLPDHTMVGDSEGGMRVFPGVSFEHRDLD